MTARAPAPTLKESYEAAGANMDRVYILDAISSPMEADGGDHEHFVHNPALLELITKRAYVMMKRVAKGRVTAIADCVASFARHSPPEALVGILQYTFSTSMNEFTDIEYMVHPDFVTHEAYPLIRQQFDDRPRLAADGGLSP